MRHVFKVWWPHYVESVTWFARLQGLELPEEPCFALALDRDGFWRAVKIYDKGRRIRRILTNYDDIDRHHLRQQNIETFKFNRYRRD